MIDPLLGLPRAVSLFQWFADRFSKNIRVRELNPNNQRDLSEVVDLYQRRIEQSQQVETQQFVDWLQDEKIRKRLRNKVFIAKYRGQIIGFLQMMMPGSAPYAFTSYFAVDDATLEGRVGAAESLVIHAMMFIGGDRFGKNSLLFEVEKPHAEIMNEKTKSDFARIRRFKSLFTRFGHCAYEIDALYFMPELPNDSGLSNRHEMRLMYVANCVLREKKITKSEYKQMLDFLYDEIYAPVYEGDEELSEVYKAELASTKEAILERCAETISLR